MYIEVLGLSFSASHFLPFHPKCSRLHGHNYSVGVRIYGKNDKFFIDFTEVKELLRNIILGLDHRTIIPVRYARKEGKASEFSHRSNSSLSCCNPRRTLHYNKKEIEIRAGKKRYLLPKEDVVLLDISLPTAEEIARYIGSRFIEKLQKKIKKEIERIEVGLEEGKGQSAWISFRFK